MSRPLQEVPRHRCSSRRAIVAHPAIAQAACRGPTATPQLPRDRRPGWRRCHLPERGSRHAAAASWTRYRATLQPAERCPRPSPLRCLPSGRLPSTRTSIQASSQRNSSTANFYVAMLSLICGVWLRHRRDGDSRGAETGQPLRWRLAHERAVDGGLIAEADNPTCRSLASSSRRSGAGSPRLTTGVPDDDR